MDLAGNDEVRIATVKRRQLLKSYASGWNVASTLDCHANCLAFIIPNAYLQYNIYTYRERE